MLPGWWWSGRCPFYGACPPVTIACGWFEDDWPIIMTSHRSAPISWLTKPLKWVNCILMCVCVCQFTFDKISFSRPLIAWLYCFELWQKINHNATNSHYKDSSSTCGEPWSFNCPPNTAFTSCFKQQWYAYGHMVGTMYLGFTNLTNTS